MPHLRPPDLPVEPGLALTQQIGYAFQHVPTVLRCAGFHVRILLPPREHGPAHVHVYRAGGAVTIDLPDGELPLRIRGVSGMRDADIMVTARLVEDHVEFLHEQWKAIHG